MKQLQLAIGHASEAGRKARNEDAVSISEPESAQVDNKGSLLVLADGVSQSADGRLAALATVRGLAADYYATPPTWECAHALERVLLAQNRWLHGQAGQGEPLATTLSALVLHGRRYTLAHVGDCRIYLMRGEHIRQLTEDHVWQHEGFRHVLKRAVGLDSHLVVDFRDGELAQDDVFALLCDGIWENLGDVQIHRLLQLHDDPQQAARALLEAALAAGSNDNVSAIVVKVVALPTAALMDVLGQRASLSIPPRLSSGQKIAQLQIEAILAETRHSIVYLARDGHGQRVVIKTLSESAARDPQLADQLLLEAWLLRRAASAFVPAVIELEGLQWLMLTMRWYPGASLHERIEQGERWSAVEISQLGLQLCHALGRLHRLDILHRDIKPENLHLDLDGTLRLLDFGSAYCPGIIGDLAISPGTPSYLAPEQFTGAPASPQTDLYAAAVSLYYILTRHYPYGEVEAFSHPSFGDPIPPSRYRPDLPYWLESVLLKALARDPKLRFETMEEMRLALEMAEAKPLRVARSSPLLERAERWQWVAVLSLLLNLLLLVLLLGL